MQSEDAIRTLEPGGPSRVSDGVAPSGLRRLLEEETSLTGNEAKAMVALLRFRTASLRQLSEATGIRRSNMHSVVDSLSGKGLCRRIGGRFSVWECSDPVEVLARLRALEKARLEEAGQRLERTFENAAALLADFSSSADESAAPITVVDDARAAAMYAEAMASVDAEILVLNRGPYAGDLELEPDVLEALARGVKARALYLSAELDGPDGQLRRCADAYAEAGVEMRVVDSLPAAMAVIGDEVVLLSFPAPDGLPSAPGHSAAIRHKGMVGLGTAAFEHLWAQGRPYQPNAPTTSTQP